MLCRLRVFILFVLLGAIVNIAVAWAFVWWTKGDGMELQLDSAPSSRLVVESWEHLSIRNRFDKAPRVDAILIAAREGVAEVSINDITVIDQYNKSEVDAWLQSALLAYPNGSPGDAMICLHATAGWPMKSVAGGIWRVYQVMALNRADLKNKEFVEGAIAVNQPNWIRQIIANPNRLPLPFFPIWSGFIINTLFYSLVLWLLFCGPGKVRRFMRKRRGRCPKCGYPIGQSPTCTECGADVARWMRINANKTLS